MNGDPTLSTSERFDTVIIGGGQADLSAGYHLAKRGERFVILDAHERIGDAWRKRWDSLRLFTPARFDGLPGWRFPAPPNSFPTKDEMAEYMAAYVERFQLPVRTGVRVTSLFGEGDRFVVTTEGGRFEAENVVVATGAHRDPVAPAFAPELDPRITQLHASDYRGPYQLADGDVLVVGAGNSGAEIALEVARTHRTFISGSPSGQLPFRHGPAAGRFVFPVIRFVGHHVLTIKTPIGRRIRPKFLALSAPLIRVKMKDLAVAGVEQVPRTAGVADGRPVLADGRALDVANVIWCTGFRQDFSWIEVPILDETGRPMHERGVAVGKRGMYFVGLPFQYAVSSDVLPGVGRDAEYIAERIASRQRASMPVGPHLPRSHTDDHETDERRDPADEHGRQRVGAIGQLVR